MKVNDYVRNCYGRIAKIEYIEDNFAYCDNWLTQQYEEHIDFINLKDKEDLDEIIKSSPNIIDLIEVGDYVNGLKITLINEPSMANCNKRLLYAEDEEGYLIKMFGEEDIKSIVTKEQFESMEYKVGD